MVQVNLWPVSHVCGYVIRMSREGDQGGADRPTADGIGSHRDLEGLYRTHATALLRLAVLLTGDLGRAEDVVQDAFVRFARAEGVPAPGSERAYLRRTVVNLVHDSHRRGTVMGRYGLGCFPSRRTPQTNRATTISLAAPWTAGLGGSGAPPPSPEAEVERVEQAETVAAAVAALPRRQRECVVLAYYEGCDEAETAEALGISRGSVKTHLHRARASLAEVLEERT